MSEATCVGLVTFITTVYGGSGCFWAMYYMDRAKRSHRMLLDFWVYTLIPWLFFLIVFEDSVCPPGLN